MLIEILLILTSLEGLTPSEEQPVSIEQNIDDPISHRESQPSLSLSNVSFTQNLPEEVYPIAQKPVEEPFDVELPFLPPSQTIYEAKPIPESLKDSIIAWIETLNIVKKDSLDSSLLPEIFRTGVLLCDIINRLEGKNSVLKGVERNPKNKTQARSNINKSLELLRKYPKHPSKHLWSANEILESNENVIWGLLEDIQSNYSVNRPKRVPKKPPLPEREPTIDSTIPSYVQPTPALSTDNSLPDPFLRPQVQVPPQPKVSSIQRGYAHRPKTSLDSSSSTYSRTSRKSASTTNFPPIPTSSKQEISNWISALGIEFSRANSLQADPLQNGVLLAEVVRIIEGVRVKINPYPKTLSAIESNCNNAVAILKKRKLTVSTALYKTLAGNEENMWNLLFSLYSTYPNAVPLAYHPCALPYSATELKELEETIVDWLIGLNIIAPDYRPSFFELIPEVKSGLLVCELASRFFHGKLARIIQDPTTEQSAINNIRKGLQVLRKVHSMSQKFTWSEREIAKGNPSVILGLLEDIYRVNTEVLPPRRSVFKEESVSRDTTMLHIPHTQRKPEPEESMKATVRDSVITESNTLGLLGWLDALGVTFPRTMSFEEEFVPEFCTGVILCEMVSKVERINLPGVEKSPRCRADALRNVRKAMAVLANKPTFPAKLASCEEAILEGEKDAIVKVLREVMKIARARDI